MNTEFKPEEYPKDRATKLVMDYGVTCSKNIVESHIEEWKRINELNNFLSKDMLSFWENVQLELTKFI